MQQLFYYKMRQKFITKYVSFLLQNATVLLQNATVLLQNATFITNCDSTISSKKDETLTDNPTVRIYVNKIKNRTSSKIKTGFYLQLLTPEIMKLFGSTKSKIIKDGISENLPYLEIPEVVLIHFNIVHNDYQHDSRALHAFFTSKSFGQ